MTGDGTQDRPARSAVTARTVRLLGGHEGALVAFVGLCFTGLFWQTLVNVNDSSAVASGIAAMADGGLAVDQIRYGNRATPGFTYHDGRLYAENYGQSFATLPVVWLLSGAVAVADPTLLAVGAWSLLLVGVGTHAGALVGRRRTGTRAGLVAALGAYVLNVALLLPQASPPVHYTAMQVTTMGAAALVGVATYRLVDAIVDGRSGLAAGLATVLATPVAVFATIPMRHVWTALLALVTLYCFHASRTAADGTAALRYRALSYVPVGLTAWVYAPEGFFLLLALGPVDLLTARSNDPRRLAVVGAVFGFSLLPFFATNVVLNGNPVRPPALMSQPPDVVAEVGGQDAARTGFDRGVASGTSSALGTVVGVALQGLLLPLRSPENLYHALVRGAGARLTEGLPDTPQATIQAAERGAANLALLESMPLAAAAVGGLPRAFDGRRPAAAVRSWLSTPAGQTDLLGVAYLAVLGLFYLPQLPVQAQITVRYLLPGMPVLVYLAARLPAVRAALDRHLRTALWTYGGVVLIGTQLVILVLAGPDVGVGTGAGSAGASDGVTLPAHSRVGLLTLAAAAALGGWSVLSTLGARQEARIGAIVLGLTAGVSTILVVVIGLGPTATGGLWLPVVERIANAAAL